MAAQWPDVEAKMLQLRLCRWHLARGNWVAGLNRLRLKVQGGSMIFPNGGTCFFLRFQIGWKPCWCFVLIYTYVIVVFFVCVAICYSSETITSKEVCQFWGGFPVSEKCGWMNRDLLKKPGESNGEEKKTVRMAL